MGRLCGTTSSPSQNDPNLRRVAVPSPIGCPWSSGRRRSSAGSAAKQRRSLSMRESVGTSGSLGAAMYFLQGNRWRYLRTNSGIKWGSFTIRISVIILLWCVGGYLGEAAGSCRSRHVNESFTSTVTLRYKHTNTYWIIVMRIIQK